jgi:hypothetical protein
MRAGQEKVFAQEVNKEQAWFHIGFPPLAVDGH